MCLQYCLRLAVGPEAHVLRGSPTANCGQYLRHRYPTSSPSQGYLAHRKLRLDLRPESCFDCLICADDCDTSRSWLTRWVWSRALQGGGGPPVPAAGLMSPMCREASNSPGKEVLLSPPPEPTPCTLHTTHYTLHPPTPTLRLTPHTLHLTPYTPHPTHYDPHPTPHTPHLTPHTLHPTLHPTRG